MIESIKSAALAGFCLWVTYVFGRSAIEAFWAKKICIKMVWYHQATEPKRFALGIVLNSLIAIVCLLNGIYFMTGGSL